MFPAIRPRQFGARTHLCNVGASTAEYPDRATNDRYRAGALVGILAAVWFLIAGCSNGGSSASGVANAASSASGSSSPSSSASPGPVAFARCMRDHGVTDYPDSGAREGSRPDLDPNNPTYRSARQACQPLLPRHSAQRGQNNAAFLRFSECMRDHGITKFPDPDPHGGPGGRGGINLHGLGIDPSSPQFKAAQHACQQSTGVGK